MKHIIVEGFSKEDVIRMKNKLFNKINGTTADGADGAGDKPSNTTEQINKDEVVDYYKLLKDDYKQIILQIRTNHMNILIKHTYDNVMLENNETFYKIYNKFKNMVLNFEQRIVGDTLQNEGINMDDYEQPMKVMTEQMRKYLYHTSTIANLDMKIEYNCRIFDYLFKSENLKTIGIIKKEIDDLTILNSKFNIFLKITVEQMNFNCIDGMVCIADADAELKQIDFDKLTKTNITQNDKIQALTLQNTDQNESHNNLKQKLEELVIKHRKTIKLFQGAKNYINNEWDKKQYTE
jgi:hypothetical protein